MSNAVAGALRPVPVPGRPSSPAPYSSSASTGTT